MPTVLLVAAIFLVTHVALSEAPLRGVFARALGERPYLWAYAALAILQLIWLNRAVAAAPVEVYWQPPAALAVILPVIHWLLLPLAVLLAVAGFTQNNPTASLAPQSMAQQRATGILAITRHPVMWSILIYAVARLLAVDRAAEAVQFLAFAVLAGGGLLRLDAKLRTKWDEARWRDFAAQTSNLPFLAMAQGRARFDPRALGLVRWIAAAAITAAAAVLL